MRVPAPDEAVAKERARKLRGDFTGPERALWKAVRDRSMFGVKVRRQMPCGPYIPDLGVSSHRSASEIDGNMHATCDAERWNAVRDGFLEEHGWRVLRFGNRDVIATLSGVLHTIARALGRGSHPKPLPEGEGAGDS